MVPVPTFVRNFTSCDKIDVTTGATILQFETKKKSDIEMSAYYIKEFVIW